MVRYFYAWIPFVIVGTIVVLALPWLGLIALMVFGLVALAALAGLAGAIVGAPYLVGRSVYRHFRAPSVATARAPVHVDPLEEARIR